MTHPSNLHVLGTKELMARRICCEQPKKIHGDNSNILAQWTEKKSIETRSISLAVKQFTGLELARLRQGVFSNTNDIYLINNISPHEPPLQASSSDSNTENMNMVH